MNASVYVYARLDLVIPGEVADLHGPMTSSEVSLLGDWCQRGPAEAKQRRKELPIDRPVDRYAYTSRSHRPFILLCCLLVRFTHHLPCITLYPTSTLRLALVSSCGRNRHQSCNITTITISFVQDQSLLKGAVIPKEQSFKSYYYWIVLCSVHWLIQRP